MSLPYVALGDSYAAGVGGGARRNDCWRAEAGYPVQVARRLGRSLAYNACLGATIADVRAHQLADLGPDTTHVSITVGGNDIGFVPVLIAAAEPSWMGNSDTAIDAALVAVRGILPARLDALFAEVAQRAPAARVVVTGYPTLFMGVDCNLATFFSTHEMNRLNGAADTLRSVIAAAAHRAGFTFARVASLFAGHEVCSDAEWVNGVSWPLEESFHPNALGHNGYAAVVTRQFGVATGSGADAAEASAGSREVEIVDGPSVPGSAPTFALPDLLSGRSLSGARSFGLDPDEVARLGEVLRQQPPDSAVAPSPEVVAAAARLHELDTRVATIRGAAALG